MGAFLGLSLLKFGNPIILDKMVGVPTDPLEVLLQPWPVSWGYWILIVLLLAAIPLCRWRIPKPVWLCLLPLPWLAWQFVSASQTMDSLLTRSTLIHFVTVGLCFYLGLFALAWNRGLKWFWLAVLLGFVAVLGFGFEQHFGGLEATRQYVFSQPGWESLPAEHLKRIRSDRIFATLFYPNSLAGVILLWLPVLLVGCWQTTEAMPRVARGVTVGLLGYAGMACLFWSGSKAGWLIAMTLGAVVVIRFQPSRRMRIGWVAALVVLGLVAFGIKFAPYFRKGATSVGARFDYWSAGLKTAWTNPFLGSGPGTFGLSYKRLKRPEAEMAQLTHNDYLQQASDSGFPSSAAYAACLIGSLGVLWKRVQPSAIQFAMWLGLLGFALQSLVEFGLYIPALAWSAWCMLGWLWGTSKEGPHTSQEMQGVA
jgi:O-antigen ligase